MNAIRDLRRKAGLTQAKLARIAGTSQPTIAAYETGRKSPTLQTLSRIARTVDLEAMVSFVTVMTREDRRSLVLHGAIADRLIKEPTEVLKHAQRNLSLMWDRNPHAHKLFAEWRSILSSPIDKIVTAVLDSDLHGRDLRKVTPFAGVLSTNERTRVYRNFARRDVAA
ncbi:MAG: helix-turn-helix transcriptional regulator [Proteobacteria bacterium]|nr:helix-turn-helix transcriptional regulator [Pseudomonadota bacterium]